MPAPLSEAPPPGLEAWIPPRGDPSDMFFGVNRDVVSTRLNGPFVPETRRERFRRWIARGVRRFAYFVHRDGGEF